jgi:uncharacterized protein
MVFPGALRQITTAEVDAGLRPGEIRLEAATSRGERVGIVHRPGTTGRYVLFLYGNAMTLADTPPIRAVLGSQGAGVVCCDYLGYGISEGENPTEGGCYRAAHAALSLIENEFGVRPGSVDVVGWSLGSAVSMHLASHRAIGRLVLMSPFAGVAPYVLGSVGLQNTPLKRLGPFAGANRVAGIQRPTLLITGDADTLTPPWMAQSLQAGLAGPSELVRIPGAGHNDLFSRKEVWKKILAFLGE